jgi:uncharacterized protein YcbK (DUF882 family)
MYNPKYFALSEFNCQETNENEMNPEFLRKLDLLREACGFPFVITSGFRSPNHTIERAKRKPGTHAQGIAADIKAISGAEKHKIIEQALALGLGGIGVARTFIHVDDRCSVDSNAVPVVWSY